LGPSREGAEHRRATISVHCHDDLGLAVANSLAGVWNGARQVEGTINGIGERAGSGAGRSGHGPAHAARLFQVHTDIDAREFVRTSRLVSDMLGMMVPANKAWWEATRFRTARAFTWMDF